MDYVIKIVYSRCHSQIAFPMVLMFFLVTLVRNCEDKSRILNDLHRITVSQPQALPSGYARGQIKICICPKAIPQANYSTIFGLRRVLCKFLIASGPRRRLRLCPRANKNLHIPAGYAEGILLHNICLQGDMQIFICFQAMPRAFPQLP
ncbi:hypothetical protein T07_4596 [Trichinella nelsoni]|uniref:Uncharacterized protein n=1 Tax=Trichinella nelsoni TaxID=6336 RepID=A0A0V0RQL8_9BILA|nr:hypothetical protein T07_4596 [Trichinella nelsoni]